METKKKLWSGGFLLALFLEFCTSMVIYMVMPIVTTYATNLGASLAMAGVIAGAFSIAAMCVRPLTGFLSDRLDKRWVLTLANAVVALACFGYFSTGNANVFLALRILHGVAFAVSGTTIVSIVLEQAPESRMGTAIGLHGLINSLASALGPALSVFLGSAVGYRCSMVVAAGLALSVSFMAFMLKKPASPSPAKKAARRLRLGDFIAPELWLLVLVGMSATLAVTAVSNYLLPLGEERAIPNVSVYFTVHAAVMFLVRPTVGRLADRYPLRVFVVPGMLLLVGGLLVMSAASALWHALLASLALSAGSAMVSPAVQAGCVTRLSPARKGVATSTYYIGVDLGQGLSPILIGAIASSIGYAGAFRWCSIILSAILLLFFLCRQQTHSALEV